MKKYEKPVLMALSLSGNEQLCGECASKGAAFLVKDNTAPFEYVASLFGDQDTVVERSDFDNTHLGNTKNIFGLPENCEFTTGVHCKFTSIEVIAWS